MTAGRDAMATVARLRFLVAALVVLVIAAVVALVVSPGSAAKREAAAQPTATTIATRSPQFATPLPTPVVAQDILPAQANAYAIGIPGPEADDLIILQTLVWQGATQGHLVFWRTTNELKMQVFPAAAGVDPARGHFQDTSSVIRYGVQQISVGRRELGIVYGPTGGCCPASAFVLLRLEGDQWRMLWDAADHTPDWRGENGQVEFPHGDLSQFIVRGASTSVVVLASGRSGDVYFVDTWVREGDQYVRQRAQTGPTPYATLVDFITALRANDDEGALQLVSVKNLVERARQLGLPGPADMPFGVTCDDDLECGKTAPLVSNMALPSVAVSFVEQNGQWLISDITKTP
jgi:hypothetical protein